MPAINLLSLLILLYLTTSFSTDVHGSSGNGGANDGSDEDNCDDEDEVRVGHQDWRLGNELGFDGGSIGFFKSGFGAH